MYRTKGFSFSFRFVPSSDSQSFFESVPRYYHDNADYDQQGDDDQPIEIFRMFKSHYVFHSHYSDIVLKTVLRKINSNNSKAMAQATRG